jgi:multidrug efflux system membrane fusion protein
MLAGFSFARRPSERVRRACATVWPVLLLAASIGCSKGDGQKGGAERPVPVVVAPVLRKDVPIEVRTIGTVEPLSTVEIVPQATGLMVGMHFKEGDFVKKGDLLFTIDTRPYRTSLAAAQAQLAKNEAMAAQAREEAERYAKLEREGLATLLELERARANAAALSASLQADRAQIQSASLNVQFTKILSPLDGRTGSVLVHPGNVVKANDNRPLVVIRSFVPAFVRFAVPEAYLPGVRAREREGGLIVHATARGNGGKSTRGQVTFMDNTVDSATGTILLKALFPNTDLELWPGEYVNVVLEIDRERDVVVAPEAAIQEGQEGAYAFVVEGNNRAALRRLRIRRRVGDVAVIEHGLKPGERVVTDGQIRVRDGVPVELKRAPAQAASPGEGVQRGAPADRSVRDGSVP